ncbi:hypothetical protein BDD12DRAFT_816019 [Trichophaea hybrida]|nr:hypothetical protein BDD12DRAFT_816019 [Trichophaea hybrida]
MPLTTSNLARQSIRWIFGILCCPCVSVLLLCSYFNRKPCRCAKRAVRVHAAIIVAPAPPPAYLDLPNPGDDTEWDPLIAHIQNGGNRVFCVRPGDGVLTSGNIAGTCPGFKIVGRPELKAVVKRTEWRGVLSGMKGVRNEVVEKFPRVRERRKGRKEPSKMEVAFVEGVCDMVEGVAVGKGEKKDVEEGCFEVWKVLVEGVGGLVHDESRRGVGGDAECVCFPAAPLRDGVVLMRKQIDQKYLWTTRVFTSRMHHGMWMLDHTDAKQVEDLFVGRWSQQYLDGEQGPLQVPDLTSYFIRFRPRRSIDSGNLEALPEEEDEDED